MENENAVVQFSIFGKTLTVQPGRVEFNRLRSRFIALAREQETVARESISQFVVDPEPLFRNSLEWARPYFTQAAELAVEELMKKGCLDLDAETYLKTVFDRSPWERRCRAAFDEFAAVVEAEQQREAERAERTESAGDSWAGGGFGLSGAIKGAVQATVLNAASAAISEGLNSLGRKQSQKENAEKIRDIFNRRREEIVQGVFLAIAEGADALVKCLNEHGIQISGVVSAADAAKAERMCNNLKTGKVPVDMIADAKIRVLEANPYCRDFYENEYMTQGDASGELEKVASYFGISFENRKKDAFLARLGECACATEDETKAYRERAVALGLELKYDCVEKLTEIDSRLEELDRLSKMAGDRVFESREIAAKQRELCEIEIGLDLSSEPSALAGQLTLIETAKKLGVDFSWKMDRVNSALERFDKEAKTVEGRVYESREMASRQRELSEFERGLDVSTESVAIESMKALESKISELGVDGEWKRVRIRSAVSRFEREACVAFGRTYGTREEAKAAKGNVDRFLEGVLIAAQQCNHRSILFGANITSKKSAGAIQHLCVHPSERLVVLIDTSLFGSVKTGLAITSIGLRWKNASVPTSRNFIAWGALSNLQRLPTVAGKSIDFGDGMMFENGGLMAMPINSLQVLLQRVVGFSCEASCFG